MRNKRYIKKSAAFINNGASTSCKALYGRRAGKRDVPEALHAPKPDYTHPARASYAN